MGHWRASLHSAGRQAGERALAPRAADPVGPQTCIERMRFVLDLILARMLTFGANLNRQTSVTKLEAS